MTNYARRAAQFDPDSAISWAEAITGSMRVESLSSIVEKWAQSDPDEAFTYVRESQNITKDAKESLLSKLE